MDRIHVASFLPVPEHGIEAIKAVDPRVEVHMISQNFARYIRDPEHPEVDAEAARAESAEIRARDEVWLCFWFGDMAADAPALKWVALGGAGADHILRGPLDDHVQITNMSGLAARVMAEWVNRLHADRLQGLPLPHRESAERELAARLGGLPPARRARSRGPRSGSSATARSARRWHSFATGSERM